MRLSVVVATVGRETAIRALLESLAKSHFSDFEVIFVNQSAVDLSPFISEFPTLTLRIFNVAFRGASRARNYGIAQAQGEIICFPDDDCEFFEDTMDQALSTMEAQQAAVVFGRCVDRAGRNSVAAFLPEPSFLSLKECTGKFVEATMFSRKAICKAFPYDEDLGVGTFHGAEEAYDLVLRLLKKGVRLYYTPSIIMYHPQKVSDYTSGAELRRVFSYRCGFAKLCRKHNLWGKYASRLFLVASFMPYLLVAKRSKMRYYHSELLGLIAGLVIR